MSKEDGISYVILVNFSSVKQNNGQKGKERKKLGAFLGRDVIAKGYLYEMEYIKSKGKTAS